MPTACTRTCTSPGPGSARRSSPRRNTRCSTSSAIFMDELSRYHALFSALIYLTRQHAKIIFVKVEPLFREMVPNLAKQLEADLRRIGRLDLAKELTELGIIDRCRCGSRFCRTFYCRQRATRCGLKYSHIELKCGVKLGVSRGHIASIQIISPAIRAILDKTIP